MNRFYTLPSVVFLTFAVLLPAYAAEKLPVFVSVVPQKYFVEQVGKERVDVKVMVQPGASPATYEPKPRQMAALSKSQIYFSIGVPFENFWLSKITDANPDMKLIRTDKGIEKLPMESDHTHNHDEEIHPSPHGAAGHKDEESYDPHIWLSPALVKLQVRTILEALSASSPENTLFFRENYDDFIERIDILDKDIQQIFSASRGMQFIVFHPSWGYFSRDYGLRQIPIEMEGKFPKPGQLKDVIRHARENSIRVIFAQPQFSTKSAQLVAKEINGRVVFADPLGYEWLQNLNDIAKKFKEALR